MFSPQQPTFGPQEYMPMLKSFVGWIKSRGKGEDGRRGRGGADHFRGESNGPHQNAVLDHLGENQNRWGGVDGVPPRTYTLPRGIGGGLPTQPAQHDTSYGHAAGVYHQSDTTTLNPATLHPHSALKHRAQSDNLPSPSQLAGGPSRSQSPHSTAQRSSRRVSFDDRNVDSVEHLDKVDLDASGRSRISSKSLPRPMGAVWKNQDVGTPQERAAPLYQSESLAPGPGCAEFVDPYETSQPQPSLRRYASAGSLVKATKNRARQQSTPPAPARAVTDPAGVLSQALEQSPQPPPPTPTTESLPQKPSRLSTASVLETISSIETRLSNAFGIEPTSEASTITTHPGDLPPASPPSASRLPDAPGSSLLRAAISSFETRVATRTGDSNTPASPVSPRSPRIGPFVFGSTSHHQSGTGSLPRSRSATTSVAALVAVGEENNRSPRQTSTSRKSRDLPPSSRVPNSPSPRNASPLRPSIAHRTSYSTEEQHTPPGNRTSTSTSAGRPSLDRQGRQSFSYAGRAGTPHEDSGRGRTVDPVPSPASPRSSTPPYNPFAFPSLAHGSTSLQRSSSNASSVHPHRRGPRSPTPGGSGTLSTPSTTTVVVLPASKPPAPIPPSVPVPDVELPWEWDEHGVADTPYRPVYGRQSRSGEIGSRMSWEKDRGGGLFGADSGSGQVGGHTGFWQQLSLSRASSKRSRSRTIPGHLKNTDGDSGISGGTRGNVDVSSALASAGHQTQDDRSTWSPPPDGPLGSMGGHMTSPLSSLMAHARKGSGSRSARHQEGGASQTTATSHPQSSPDAQRKTHSPRGSLSPRTLKRELEGAVGGAVDQGGLWATGLLERMLGRDAALNVDEESQNSGSAVL